VRTQCPGVHPPFDFGFDFPPSSHRAHKKARLSVASEPAEPHSTMQIVPSMQPADVRPGAGARSSARALLLPLSRLMRTGGACSVCITNSPVPECLSAGCTSDSNQECRACAGDGAGNDRARTNCGCAPLVRPPLVQCRVSSCFFPLPRNLLPVL
jgi:hypothetical protein